MYFGTLWVGNQGAFRIQLHVAYDLSRVQHVLAEATPGNGYWTRKPYDQCKQREHGFCRQVFDQWASRVSRVYITC